MNTIEIVRQSNSALVSQGLPLGTVNVSSTVTNNNLTGISSLNGLSGIVLLTGAGEAVVSVNGQIITVTSTSSASAATSGLATSGFCTGISGVLQEQVNTLNNNTGNYYLKSNPQQYVTSGNLQATGQSLQNQISAITAGTGNFISAAQTGQFYPASNPNQYVNSGSLYQTGSNLDNKINSLSGYSNTTFSTITNLASTGSNLQGQINSINNNTGLFYLNSNPSGYLNTLSGLSVSYVTGVSGALQSQFYPNTNPNQYIRSGDVSSIYSTITNLQSTGANLQSQINNITNNTGQFYLSSNPQQYVNSGNLFDTGNALNNKINSLSGYANDTFATIANLYSTGDSLQSSINNLNNNTGNYYLNSNEQRIKTILPTGSNFIYIQYNSNFPSTPCVWMNLQTSGNFSYHSAASGISISGYTAIFSDIIRESGNILHSLIKLI